MKQTSLALAISLIVANQGVQGNPSGAQVVHGTATFSNPSANVLNITNSHNAIINWQSFNIGAGQTTNFIQPSTASSVLNRVISNNPSQIFGNLNSNGRVYLINQHGILVGEGANINTAGFLGSTLNITDSDFLNGNLKFEGGGQGGIENLGYIHAGENGHIVLIAPHIKNGGVVEVDNGNIILAAGKSIIISSLENPAIHFEVSGDENNITNLGEIIANRGAASLFAGTLEHSGSIRANGVVQNADGSISLVTRGDMTVTAGAAILADGENGGQISLQSEQGVTLVEGDISATGSSGSGGSIQLLGEYVAVSGDAKIDASGVMGGGQILVGGDFQGQNPEVQNASSTYVGQDAALHADALESGNGGKVIVWSDEATRSYGDITARGGTQSGDGGFIETSGGYLELGDLVPDASAVNGENGAWLIDPNNITISSVTSVNMTTGPDFTTTDDDAFINVSSIETALNAGTDVSITTGVAGNNTEPGNIFIQTDISTSSTSDVTLTLTAHDDIVFDTVSVGDLSIDATGAGSLNIILNPNTGVGDLSPTVGLVDFDTDDISGNNISINTSGGSLTINGDGAIGGEGSLNLVDTNWTISSDTTFSMSSTATPVGININGNSTLVNNGTIEMDTATINGSGNFENNGTIIANGLSTSSSSINTANLNFTHNGAIQIQDLNDLTLSGGQLDLGPGSSLSGYGTLNGNVTMDGGMIYGGDGFTGNGTLNIGGNLTINSGLLFSVLEAPDGLGSSNVFANLIDVTGGSAMAVWQDSAAPADLVGVGLPSSTSLLTCGGTGCMTGTGFDVVVDPLLVTNSNVTFAGGVGDTFIYEISAMGPVTNIVTWTGGANGLWSNASNWSTGAVPTAADYVFLDDVIGTATVQINSVETIAGLQSFEVIDIQGGGDLTINGDAFVLDDQEVDDGLLEFSAADARLNGTGVLYTGPGAKLNFNLGSLNKDLVNWGSIGVTGAQAFTVNSNLVNHTGQLYGAGSLTFGSGAIFDAAVPQDLSSLSTLNLNGSTFLNAQNILFPDSVNMAGSSLQGAGSIDIAAIGTWNIQNSQLMGLDVINLLTINNSGTVNILGDTSTPTSIINTDFINNGGQLTGSGSFQVATGATLYADSSVNLANLELVGGTLNTTTGFTHAGNFDWIAGTVIGSGLTTSGQVNLTSGQLNTDWLITSTGLVDWTSPQGYDLIIDNATITNQGEFYIRSFIDSANRRLGSGGLASKNFSLSTNATFINEGLLIIDADPFPGLFTGDPVIFDLNFVNQGGTIGIASGVFSLGGQDLVLDAGESLQGYGTFQGNVINQGGVVSPGRSDLANNIFQVGDLTINGNYQQDINSTLVIKMDSTLNGLQHDSLDVTGQLAADGEVRFEVINNSSILEIALLLDQSFQPLTYGNFAGRFSDVVIPPGLNFTLGADGVITITSNILLLNELANELEVLLNSTDLDYTQIVQAMKFLDKRFRHLRRGDDDEEWRAPRLVCR